MDNSESSQVNYKWRPNYTEFNHCNNVFFCFNFIRKDDNQRLSIMADEYKTTNDRNIEEYVNKLSLTLISLERITFLSAKWDHDSYERKDWAKSRPGVEVEWVPKHGADERRTVQQNDSTT